MSTVPCRFPQTINTDVSELKSVGFSFELEFPEAFEVIGVGNESEVLAG